MDGENNGKPANPIKMDDLWGKPTVFGNIHIYSSRSRLSKGCAVGTKNGTRGVFEVGDN